MAKILVFVLIVSYRKTREVDPDFRRDYLKAV